MDKIANLLKTPEAAQALRANLKAMPESEKAKANYQKVWQMVCSRMNEYNLQKMKQKQSELVKPKDKTKIKQGKNHLRVGIKKHRPSDYGDHYYTEKRFFEIKEILAEY